MVMVAPSIVFAVRSGIFDQPVEASQSFLSVAIVSSALVHQYVSPRHVSPTLGALQSWNAKEGSEVDRGSKHNLLQDSL